MPTLEEELLRKASSIGSPYPKELQTRAEIPIPIGPLKTLGTGLSMALDEGGVGLLKGTLNHYKNLVGDMLLRKGLTYARDQFEHETGARLPRTIPEAWNLLMNRDNQLANAQPPAGSYPIAYNKTP